MRSLAIDIGNTRTKIGVYQDGRLLTVEEWSGGEWPKADNAIASITGCEAEDLPKGCLRVSSRLKLPIRLDYETPNTLGSDRIAAATGAQALGNGRPMMVVDAGTCVTVDFVDAAGVYRGGAIMPGLRMKFQALHNFTAKLPLLNINDVEKEAEILGKSTYGSIVSGVVLSTRLALEGYERKLSEQVGEPVMVVVTGGDAERLSGDWRIEPHLVMNGMYEILQMNI